MSHAEREDRTTVECSIKVDETSAAGDPALLHALEVVFGYQVLHHVLDGFGSRVHDIHFEVVVLHYFWCVLVYQSVVVEALLGDEIGVCNLVVRGPC